MAQEINLTEASIYVGTYAKYNNGSIAGKWLDLSNYSDITEFYEACAKLHEDEQDPEYMFQDWEHIPDSLISEYGLSDKIFEIRDSIENLNEIERAAFMIWCDNDHKNLAKENVDDLINSFHEDFIGEYASEEDFARELAGEHPDLSDFALQYFDAEAYARDLFNGDYWSQDGYIFHNS